MYKLFISVAGSGIVLMGGLASCSRESKSPDQFSLSPPFFQTATGNISFKEFESSKSKALDLQDMMDFTESRPARIRVTAACEKLRISFTKETTFTGISQIQIWQILPPELNTALLDHTKGGCSMMIALFNEVGSQHILPALQFFLTDNGEWPVKLESSIKQSLPVDLTPATASGNRARYDNKTMAGAVALCQDARTKSIPFDQVLDFGNFDLRITVPVDALDQWALEQRPLQTCRIQISEGGRPAAMSRTFAIFFQPPKPIVTALPVQAPGANPAEQLSNVYNQQTWMLGRWSIQNLEHVTRRIRIPNQILKTQLDLIGAWPSPPSLFQFFNQGVQIRTNRPFVQGDAFFYEVAIPPGESAELFTELHPGPRRGCPPAGLTSLFAATKTGILVVGVTTEEGMVYDSITLQTPDRMIQNGTVDSPPILQQGADCAWN